MFRYVVVFAVLAIMSGCSLTPLPEIRLPFVSSKEGDCLRINTNVPNYKYNGQCVLYPINVTVSLAKASGVKSLDNVQCRVEGPSVSGSFKPNATLLVPHAKESTKPLLVECSAGNYRGKEVLHPVYIPNDRRGFADFGYGFRYNNLKIVLE